MDDESYDIIPIVFIAAVVTIGILLVFVVLRPAANVHPREIKQPTTCNCNCGCLLCDCKNK